MRKWLVKLERWMNNYKLNKKLLFLYVVCVLLPLIVTDSVVIYIALHTEEVKQQHMMENDVNAVQFSFSNSIESAASVVKAVDANEYIDNFLNEKYESSLSYFVACNKAKNLLFNNIGGDSSRMTIYADNETITNGGKFSRLSSIKDEEWYQYMVQTGCNTCVYTYYDQSRSPVVGAKRKILFLRRMNCYGSGCEKVVKIELDYGALVRGLVKMNYESPIYICSDGKILYSNDGKSSSTGMDFLPFIYEDQVGYEKEMTVYGKTLQIYALKSKTNIVDSMLQNAPLILLLVLINAVFPLTFMVAINRSLTTRIRELGQAFESVDQDRLVSIACVRGKDEIGALMQNYNRMVDRTNELIQTVYKDRLKKQEMDIARQHAELLALHSQINPHFLFNALESIRMHSIIKQEYETADMVSKLAVMTRQNVDWGEELVEIRREMEFVEAYLGLQKYRFGDRLSYQLDVAEDCRELRLPKLTVVTFVENACVHGIESKTTPGWIFVRISRDEEELCIEVEDTGDGMDEQTVKILNEKLQNPSIEQLKDKSRVGMLNASLRIKMLTSGNYRISIESEQGVGTMIQLRLSLEALMNSTGI
ncbi:MAG: sensor histidine kinase [Lachnospiraceae bacterium]|nr:sensor histidine kinase [Lachnospiraceae bacterium]MDY5521841.1 sensor histidine kinase [Agathobacter sp.]